MFGVIVKEARASDSTPAGSTGGTVGSSMLATSA